MGAQNQVQALGSRRNQSRCRRKRATEARYIRLRQNNFLTARGVSVEDRSKQTETARPHIGEHGESQSELDSGVSVKNDGK